MAEPPAQEPWDAIVVGAGMGGAAAGYGLARLGAKVLILERGMNTHRAGSGKAAKGDGAQVRMAQGWWPYKVAVDVDKIREERFLPLGSGAGGSSIFYGAAIERLDARDFEPRRHHKGGDDSLLPEAWPFGYDALEPYYGFVERQFSVCGTPDPLRPASEGQFVRPPPELSARDANLKADLEAVGLHPYRVHTAVRHLPRCQECIGRLCRMDCKIDADNGFLQQALEHGAHYQGLAEVEEILTADGKAIGVRYNHDGRPDVAHAKKIILAGGALLSPLLLMQSGNGGLANSSGLVGQCLMFHIGNQFAVWPKKQADDTGPRKSLAFNDFYAHDGAKFGSVQTVGPAADRAIIHTYLKTQLFPQRIVNGIPFFGKALGIAAIIGSKLFGKAQIMTAILEDLPYRENRIVPDSDEPSGFRIDYTVRDELRSRTFRMRKMIQKTLRRNLVILIDRGVRMNFGHPSGTLRAGDDPHTSVVDAHCKTHDIDDLYVVDASVMPSSGGVNPSATIAANALRVADHIHNQLYPDRETSILSFEPDGPGVHDDQASTEEPRKITGPEGLVVMITGAGSGLGLALAEGFLNDGATVAAIGRSEDKLKRALEGHDPARVTLHTADVSDPDAVQGLVDDVMARHGRIDVLINNAAVYRRASVHEEDPRVWWDAMATNLLGPFALSSAVLPIMEKQRSGRIVMVGSNADKATLPGSSSYSVSKGALHTLTRALAGEVNRDKYPEISIFELVPGPMQTRMGSAKGRRPADNYEKFKEAILARPGKTHGTSGGGQQKAAKRGNPIKRAAKKLLGRG